MTLKLLIPAQPYKATKRYGFTSIEPLPFLHGKPWDPIAMAWVHSLRPSSVRISQDGFFHCDAQTWRVSVHVDAHCIIQSIRQEVQVGLPEGVENGLDLRRKTGDI